MIKIAVVVFLGFLATGCATSMNDPSAWGKQIRIHAPQDDWRWKKIKAGNTEGIVVATDIVFAYPGKEGTAVIAVGVRDVTGKLSFQVKYTQALDDSYYEREYESFNNYEEFYKADEPVCLNTGRPYLVMLSWAQQGQIEILNPHMESITMPITFEPDEYFVYAFSAEAVFDVLRLEDWEKLPLNIVDQFRITRHTRPSAAY